MNTVIDRIKSSGLSSDQLTDRTGIPRDRLERIAQGAEPSLGELRSLARALGGTVADFMPETGAVEEATLLFRRTASKPGSTDRSLHSFSKRIGGALDVMGRGGSVAWLNRFRVADQTYEEAARIAAHFRDTFVRGDQVSPLLNLPALVVNDLSVLLFVVNNNTFDGASAVVGGHAFTLVAARFKPRMLFTLAHELGHLLAHHSAGLREFAVLDEPEDIGDIKRSTGQLEAFADAFASCLLLPAQGVGIALKKIKSLTHAPQDALGDVEILYLSRIFGVSFQVAARRCEDLTLLPSGGAISLYEHLCSLYDSPEKRAEHLGLPTRADIQFPAVPPTLLNQALQGIREGAISAGRAATILNMSLSDLFRINARS